MPAFGVKLEPGFTTEQYRTALLTICTQAWGAYTLLNSKPGTLMLEHDYIEWPDITGRKHFWHNTSSTNFIPRIATNRQMPSTTWVYQNTQGNQGISANPSDKTLTTYLIAVSGPNYRGLTYITSEVQRSYIVGEFQGAAPWWGSYERVFHTTDRSLLNTLPGLNPTGAFNAQGNANPAGVTSFNLNLRNTLLPANPITGKREVRINSTFQEDGYGILGYMPRDVGIAAAGGISDDAPVIYDCGEDGLYVSFNVFSNAQWCVKVDASPIAGLTVYPAHLYDFGDPPEGVAVTPPLVELWPSYGQTFPNMRSLELMPGGTNDDP